MERNKTVKAKDSANETILPLLGKALQGQASKIDIEALNKACKQYLASEPAIDRQETDRFMAAEQIMEILVAEGSVFTSSESAELRRIFFRSDNPFKTLAAMRKVKSVF